MKIAVRIESLLPDRTTYKQYSTKYAPNELYVEAEVPDEEAHEYTDRTILTERGLQILIGKLADVADDVELEYLHSQLPK